MVDNELRVRFIEAEEKESSQVVYVDMRPGDVLTLSFIEGSVRVEKATEVTVSRDHSLYAYEPHKGRVEAEEGGGITFSGRQNGVFSTMHSRINQIAAYRDFAPLFDTEADTSEFRKTLRYTIKEVKRKLNGIGLGDIVKTAPGNGYYIYDDSAPIYDDEEYQM